ncbi:hypothetical protein T439DRAFT_322299 [Meredithblackwellia eburnea MCA 4105]
MTKRKAAVLVKEPTQSSSSKPTASGQQGPSKALLAAIDAASPERVKAALIAVLTAHPEAADKATAELEEGVACVPTPKKRKIWENPWTKIAREAEEEPLPKGMAICKNCESEYDLKENRLPLPRRKSQDDGSVCYYHPGTCYLDKGSDIWYDWCYDSHGEMDTPAHREEWPEAFLWDCCQQDGGYPCKRARHVPKVMRQTRHTK